MIIRFCYSFVLWFVSQVLKLPFFGNEKLILWREGQKTLFKHLNHLEEGSILFIIASNGEFEQAKPLLEHLKKNYPNEKITISFFSPSAFANHSWENTANQICYFPLDTKQKTKRFIDRLKPKLVVFVKYELWLNFMTTLRKQQIPRFLISGVFPKRHFLFQWYGKEHLKEFSTFTKIFVQDDLSQQQLKNNGIDSTVAGDTRIDRSLELPHTPFKNSAFTLLPLDTVKIVIGSAWPKDLTLFASIKDWLDEQNIQLIIAPHELNPQFLTTIKNTFHSEPYSTLHTSKKVNQHILVDSIGKLKFIYRYGHIAYIGGGFGKGIHNTLEPASYGLPVIFGPNHEKFVEAKALKKEGGGFSIRSSSELKETLDFLLQDKKYIKVGLQAKNYLEHHKGATEQIVNHLKNYL